MEITRETVRMALLKRKLHPSVPEVVVAVIEMVQSPTATIHQLVYIIEKDEALAARIVNIANSGFYGSKRKIATVRDAIILMGWNTVKMITLGSTILKRMSQQDRRLFTHSVQTAHIARFLATEADFYKVDEIAVVGLLHDLGLVVMETYFSDRFLSARQYAVEYGVPTHVAERELFGTDHAEIGGWTLKEWRLPENIIESVARHHSFDPDTYHARKTAVIHVADVLAVAIDYRGPAWEKVTALEPTALETLRFTQGELKDLLLTIMKMPFEPIIL